MPVKAAWVECEGCGKGTKLAKPFAIIRGGKVLCEKCTNQPRYIDQVYMWISPTWNVTNVAKPKTLDDPEPPPGPPGSIEYIRWKAQHEEAEP